MKKSRIKGINMHLIPITDEKKVEINYAFSKIYARFVSDKLDEKRISDEQKIEIVKCLMNK